MRPHSTSLATWIILTAFCLSSRFAQGQILDGGQPNPEDERLYSWYDAADFIGADGDPVTPIWPNKQGALERSIWSGFGTALNVVETPNGLPAVEFVDIVTWSNVEDFGILEENFTIFIAATVRDPSAAYFFTGNQGGGGTEVNANYQTDEFDTWTLKADLDRIPTAPVVTDELQYHAFTFRDDEMGVHHLNGELAGQGEVGFASLQGLVLGGRQNGAERSGVDFAEVLIYSTALNDADREAIEGYLAGKYFGAGGIRGDFNGDGVLDALDIDDLTAQSASNLNNLAYDLNADGAVNTDDVTVWIRDLYVSWVGDADLDGEFRSTDLVQVLASGTYEVDVDAVWTTGDFNGDGRTNSTDLVAGLADGGYEVGPRTDVAAVPEPTSVVLLLSAIVLCGIRRPRHA